jgi:hypothetical protein
MRNTARRTRDNRTITVDFHDEATYLEAITKWGLRSFLLLVQTCLHPGVPATKCYAQIIV